LLHRTPRRRNRRIRTGTARRTQTGRERDRFQIRLAKRSADLFLADKNLEDTGNGKAQHERPERRPEHRQRMIQTEREPMHCVTVAAPPLHFQRHRLPIALAMEFALPRLGKLP